LLARSWFVSFTMQHPPSCTLFPYTTLFRSALVEHHRHLGAVVECEGQFEESRLVDQVAQIERVLHDAAVGVGHGVSSPLHAVPRSEEHTSELQSRENLVCRLLLEKKTIAIR